jgi:hypothetical protein
MALEVRGGQSLMNSGAPQSPPLAKEEADALYDELLRLRDAIIAGRTSLKLPAAVIDQLRDSIPHALPNGTAAQQPNGVGASQTAPFPSFTGLPGLQASVGSSAFASSTQTYNNAQAPANTSLDPIFLEKSDGLVRAEGQLKRKRLERQLQDQVDARKHSSKHKDDEAPSPIQIDDVLKRSLELVKPISGLKPEDAAESSFDENDYYSSQVQSEWSSPTSSRNGVDGAAGAFTADFERLDGTDPAPVSKAKRPAYVPAAPAAPVKEAIPYLDEDDDLYEPEDEDDEYAPPDIAGVGGFKVQKEITGPQPGILPEDENSDYEPGELLEDSSIPTPSSYNQAPIQPSPQVQIVRNHLTHIAAPQPNRVSPLATAKGPNIELELVNGSPQVVSKPQQSSNYGPSRVSTASPSGNNAPGSGKKKKNKKRKRDHEPTGRAKRRQRQNALEPAAGQEPYIKDEPVSPPPFSNVPDYQPYARMPPPQQRTEPQYVSQVTPMQSHSRHGEPPRSGLRFEYGEPASSATARVGSPSQQRPVQKDTQNLRRVASIQYAQRPASPPRPGPWEPVAPYRERVTSMAHEEPRMNDIVGTMDARQAPAYQELQALPPQYSRTARSPSPPRLEEYRDHYAEPPGTIRMAPPPLPAAPPRRVFVDQYGQRWMEEEPAPPPSYTSRASAVPSYVSRASVAPVERRRQPEYIYEHAVPTQDSTRYQPEPASPVYQQVRTYEQPSRAREPTSPVYQQVHTYEQMPPPPLPPSSSYLRQGTVAPVQYAPRQDPAPLPARAASVMPVGNRVPTTQAASQRNQSQAAQPVRYLDQYGNEVFPRQVSEVRYQ